jgi:hypothetical protein
VQVLRGGALAGAAFPAHEHGRARRARHAQQGVDQPLAGLGGAGQQGAFAIGRREH